VSQTVDSPYKSRLAGEALNKFRLTRPNSAGAAVYCDAGEKPEGPVGAYTADTDPCTITLLANKEGTVRCIAVGTFSILAPVFTQDDGKIDDVNTGYRVGYALEACTVAGQEIEVLPDPGYVSISNAAAATGVGATSTSEEDIDVTAFVPVNELRAGKHIRVKAWGIVTDQDSTPQCDVKLYANTELIATATVAAAADNDQCIIEADIIIRTLGATGTLIALAKTSFDAAGTGVISALKAQATEDISAGITFKCTATFNASHADNDFRLDGLTVEQLN